MAETTGGRPPATDRRRVPVALVAHVAEGAAQAAYRAYVEHRPGCQACQSGETLQCVDAEALWDAYREARAQH